MYPKIFIFIKIWKINASFFPPAPEWEQGISISVNVELFETETFMSIFKFFFPKKQWYNFLLYFIKSIYIIKTMYYFQSQGLNQRTVGSQARSTDLLSNARNYLGEAQSQLEPELIQAKQSVASVAQANEEAETGLDDMAK